VDDFGKLVKQVSGKAVTFLLNTFTAILYYLGV